MAWLLLLLMSWASLSTELLQERYLFGQLARRDLIAFARLTMPLPSDALNPRVSRYIAANHHRHVAAALQRIDAGEINRLLISIPYRHGKSELAVRKFVPWYMAGGRRGPHGRSAVGTRSVICITHSDSLAWEHGRDVRNNFRCAGYRLAFGAAAAQLRDDSQARDRLQLEGGGMAMFTGRAGLGGGFGANLLLFDDFFKNAEEAQSQTVRDHAWECYIADCKSRLNEETGAIVIIETRKHEDDVTGRILDPTNQHYDAREAGKWTVVRLPALAEEDDPLGRKIDEPLWPERFGFEFWNEKRTHSSDLIRMDFQTQGQCNPTPAEGNYFKKKWLKTYRTGELPEYLRFYVSSDHTFRKEQKNDRSCLLAVGIDPSDVIWVLPDTWWHRCETDELVEAMLALSAARKPGTWFAAKDAISGSIGPFWRKRMRETRNYVNVEEITEDRDLIRRAQSFRNRCAMGMVRWPVDAPWWGEAEKELLAFPNGKHDDLVAACGILGMGLDRLLKAEGPWVPSTGLPKPGTLAWVKAESRKQKAEKGGAKGW
jgi:hypothetical protein